MWSTATFLKRKGRERGVSQGAWYAFDFVLALLFVAGFFYFYVSGVHFEDRALSRSSALAFLVCLVVAVWRLVKIL